MASRCGQDTIWWTTLSQMMRMSTRSRENPTNRESRPGGRPLASLGPPGESEAGVATSTLGRTAPRCCGVPGSIALKRLRSDSQAPHACAPRAHGQSFDSYAAFVRRLREKRSQSTGHLQQPEFASRSSVWLVQSVKHQRPLRPPGLAIQKASTTVVAPRHCELRWRWPSSGRLRRQVSCLW
jgi:hypothetical protein